nr:hypothetical protein [Burkholderia ubonensis]
MGRRHERDRVGRQRSGDRQRRERHAHRIGRAGPGIGDRGGQSDRDDDGRRDDLWRGWCDADQRGQRGCGGCRTAAHQRRSRPRDGDQHRRDQWFAAVHHQHGGQYAVDRAVDDEQ